jgi:tripartite-type tricarboxylate transporter receptor subunit TctC
MKTHKHLAVGATIFATALAMTACSNAAASSANTETYPSSDLTLMVPYAAGGGSDLTSRTIADILEDQLGVNVVVQNQPGAGGAVGYMAAADADADGYTISVTTNEVATLQYLDYEVSPDDFAYIGQANVQPGAIAVASSSDIKTFDDLVAAAKKAPGKITYGTPGAGSSWEAMGRGIGEAADIELQPVPFDGNASSIAAVIGGSIDATLASTGEMRSGIASGDLRVLAVMQEERLEEYPDIPTVTELGYDIVTGGLIGFMAPKETPSEIIQQLESALEKAVADERFQKVMKDSGFVASYMDSETFTSEMQKRAEDFGRWFEGS